MRCASAPSHRSPRIRRHRRGRPSPPGPGDPRADGRARLRAGPSVQRAPRRPTAVLLGSGERTPGRRLPRQESRCATRSTSPSGSTSTTRRLPSPTCCSSSSRSSKTNHKDYLDMLALLCDHELTDDDRGINLRYVSDLGSDDWGLWRTINPQRRTTRSHRPRAATDSTTPTVSTSRSGDSSPGSRTPPRAGDGRCAQESANTAGGTTSPKRSIRGRHLQRRPESGAPRRCRAGPHRSSAPPGIIAFGSHRIRTTIAQAVLKTGIGGQPRSWVRIPPPPL